MTEAEIKAEAFRLMQRHAQLGIQLPAPGDIGPHNADEARLILDEMFAVQKQLLSVCGQSKLRKVGDLPPRQRAKFYRRIEREMQRQRG